jgi:ubiquinone/menaquinone biosynthesis C-methylase UbiE
MGLNALTASIEEIEAMNLRGVNAWAHDFAEVDENVYTPIDDIRAFLQLIPGESMLDVGCGWGRYVIEFTDEELRYTGCDFSEHMLAEARRRNPNERFDLASYRSLPYPDASFDGIWCCCVLDHEPKRTMSAVLHELRRVLKPGGIFYAIHPLRETSDEFVAHSRGIPMYFSHWDLYELEAAIVNVGFGTIRSFKRFEHGSMTHVMRKV